MVEVGDRRGLPCHGEEPDTGHPIGEARGYR